jgi:hypothetical protein
MNCLIGHTGFIGSNLKEMFDFDFLYNTSNIQKISEKDYNHIICSGTPGVKWRANKFPDEDKEKINLLIKSLKNVKAKKFTLLSTIDVYNNPKNVTEENIKSLNHNPYGSHRSILEDFISENFNNFKIIRLPIVYGKYFKKNYLYDLMNSNNLENICLESKVQFYDVSDLVFDIGRYWGINQSVINAATEPVLMRDIIDKFFPNSKENCKSDKVFETNMMTAYSDSGYFYSKDSVLSKIKRFVT